MSEKIPKKQTKPAAKKVAKKAAKKTVSKVSKKATKKGAKKTAKKAAKKAAKKSPFKAPKATLRDVELEAHHFFLTRQATGYHGTAEGDWLAACQKLGVKNPDDLA